MGMLDVNHYNREMDLLVQLSSWVVLFLFSDKWEGVSIGMACNRRH